MGDGVYMKTYYLISDILQKSAYDYVTGYWDGEVLREDMREAKHYAELEEARLVVVESGCFRDPLVYKVEGVRKEVALDMAKGM